MQAEMSSLTFKESVYLTFHEKYVRNICICLTLFCTALGAISPLAAVFIFIHYLLGYVICYGLIKYKKQTSFYFKRLTSFYKTQDNHTKLKQSCSICDDLTCRRHLFGKPANPWKNLFLDKKLSCEIEKFFDIILSQFITSWYKEFTEDTDFILELKYCIRYATAMVTDRFLELDRTDIILKKLLPCVIKHIDDYYIIEKMSKSRNQKFDMMAIEYLGKKMHVAATNRKNELLYLEKLSTRLENFILPDSYLKCDNFTVLIREIIAGWVFLPLMDVLADPNIINLLIVYTKFKQLLVDKSQNTQTVEFLHNYGKISNKKSSFYNDLNKVKENTDLLYAFMQYLKKYEVVNLLQFCLEVDDFNIKLLNPELNPTQLEELHKEAQKLYKEYLDMSSFNFIHCSDNISSNINLLLTESVGSVEKLRTSDALFKAYEHTFSQLEENWLPKFYRSTEFYNHICGLKLSTEFKKEKATAKSRRYMDPQMNTMSKIGTGLGTGIGRLKSVLRSAQTIEGALYPENYPIGNGSVDDLILACDDVRDRDMNSWIATVIDTKPSPSHNILYFRIEVQSINQKDNTKKHWEIYRKDQDFLTLKTKLVEFHGEQEICDSPLPTRKSDYSIIMRKNKYESFLNKLLQKPQLRGSDLLYAFLTTDEDFSLLLANSYQDLGTIYQSVTQKLRKEKGQHLDTFMNSFLTSTGRDKSDTAYYTEIGDEMVISPTVPRKPPPPKTYKNYIFNDNFGIALSSLQDNTSSSFVPLGIPDSIFYLLKNLFKVRNIVLKLYVVLCNISQTLVDSVAKVIVDRLLGKVQQRHLAELVALLEGVIFEPRAPVTSEDLLIRKRQAFIALGGCFPRWVNHIFGGHLNSGLTNILEVLQSPHYNKQLVYSLLDIVILEMYPSLDNMDLNKT